MRKTFETEIQQLKDELLLLGSMVEKQILDLSLPLNSVTSKHPAGSIKQMPKLMPNAMQLKSR